MIDSYRRCRPLIVVAVTRPKIGSEAVAFGMVVGLKMAITMFTLQIDATGLKEGHEDARHSTKSLAKLAIGTEAQAEEGSKLIYKKYAGLLRVPAEERANILAFRIFYDSFFQVPLSIIFGLLVTTILCIVPCMAETLFANKLLHERGRLRRGLLPYMRSLSGWS